MSSSPELTVAREAARAGGDIVARYFREGVTMRSKAVANLVSDADIGSERAIAEIIRRAFPTHEIYGEEEQRGSLSAEHLWLIDPLDGTHNFAHRITQFSVSIAYYRAGVPECGVIYDPIHETWSWAVRGQGAFHQGEPAHVSEFERLEDVLVAFGFGYDHEGTTEAVLKASLELARKPVLGLRRFGGAALDLVMVGRGQLGGFFEYRLNLYDFAAGRLFVEEAGGKVTTCTGDPLPMGRTTILASNGRLHDTFVKILQPHIPRRS